MEAGKVWLAPNSFDVMNQIQAVELKPEMIDWSIKLESDDSPDYCRNMFKAALVLAKSGFTIYISMGINHEKKLMYPPIGGGERFSGIICLADEILVTFLEPKKNEEGLRSFLSIMDWVEDSGRSEVKRWTVNQWKDFFIRKIAAKSSQELSEAEKQVESASNNLAQKQEKYNSVSNAVKKAKANND